MKPSLRNLLSAAGPFLGLILVIGLFSIDPEVRSYFLTTYNFKIILTQTVIVAVGALGMTLIIVSGGIDLSVGSVVALTGVVGALVLREGQGAFMAVAAAILTGGLIGALNGSLIAGLRIMPFVVTLGMLGIARGMAKWLGDNQTIQYPDSPLNGLMASADPLSSLPPPGVWVAVVLAILTAIMLRQTVFGRHIFALGSNEATARLCGLPVGRLKIFIYTLAGLYFGLAGVMQMTRLRQGDPTVAVGVELDIIAAVVIGGASLSGGTGTVMGSIIGALIMSVLRNGSQQMGWPTYIQEIIIGAVIILAVALDRVRQARKQ
ncbi:MAG: ABC transporter permease [Opitutaceae bacterium]